MIAAFGAVIIVGIFIVQIYWVRKAFNAQEQQFNQTVQVALSNVSEQLQKKDSTISYPLEAVSQLSSNYYILNVNGKIDTSLLSNCLRTEFSSRNIKTDVEYGIYDSVSNKMLYGKLINTDTNHTSIADLNKMPSLVKGQYYLGIFLPTKTAHLADQMDIWIFSTLLLLIFVLFFCYALFIILKQKRLSELQKDFVNNMTHEFRTPISTIVLSAETISNHGGSKEDLSMFAGIITKEATRLDQHVERILQMVKSESTKVTLCKEKIDLHQIISENVKRCAFFTLKNVNIETSLEARHPFIVADKDHLTNVIFNLLDNSFKYSPANSKVIIKTQNLKGEIVLTIEDNGIGISREFRNKIFKPFFRVPTGNLHNVKGFGLGLNYVKNIVKAHEWRIDFLSAENCGSRFSIHIPA
jgi:two-component system phosphate regulon sensor histidine kinase PhoR